MCPPAERHRGLAGRCPAGLPPPPPPHTVSTEAKFGGKVLALSSQAIFLSLPCYVLAGLGEEMDTM